MQKRGKASLVKKILKTIFAVILVIFILSILFAMINITLPNSVAIIPIKGTIVSGDSGSFFEVTTSADAVIEKIEKAEENPNIKAILFEINSGGGYPVASEEIAQKIKSVKKPTLALIREVGASGAYWIASASDTIMANRMSVTGSIGVYASYLEFSGLLNEHNVSYQRIIAGKYKDLGSPYKDMTLEEEELFQAQVNKIHEYFVSEIASNRNMTFDETMAISTGMFYLGEEALELGLIDHIGNKEDALNFLKQSLNLNYINEAEYKEKRGISSIFTSVFSKQSYAIGKGIGSALTDNRKNTLQISLN